MQLGYPVDAGDAIVGARVRDLALPRDAVVRQPSSPLAKPPKHPDPARPSTICGQPVIELLRIRRDEIGAYACSLTGATRSPDHMRQSAAATL